MTVHEDVHVKIVKQDSKNIAASSTTPVLYHDKQEDECYWICIYIQLYTHILSYTIYVHMHIIYMYTRHHQSKAQPCAI